MKYTHDKEMREIRDKMQDLMDKRTAFINERSSNKPSDDTFDSFSDNPEPASSTLEMNEDDLIEFDEMNVKISEYAQRLNILAQDVEYTKDELKAQDEMQKKIDEYQKSINENN